MKLRRKKTLSSFLISKAEVQPMDTCFLPIFSLKCSNAHRCKVIQCICTDCALQRATNWFADFITCSVHCTVQHILLQVLSDLNALHTVPFGDKFNFLTSLQASKLRYNPAHYSLTGLRCRATSAAKNFWVLSHPIHAPIYNFGCPAFAALVFKSQFNTFVDFFGFI